MLEFVFDNLDVKQKLAVFLFTCPGGGNCLRLPNLSDMDTVRVLLRGINIFRNTTEHSITFILHSCLKDGEALSYYHFNKLDYAYNI